MEKNKRIVGTDSMREIYLAERARRQNIRAQLSVPVSIISFSIFGYVSFAAYFDVSQWRQPVTFIMILLMAASLAFLFMAMLALARVERRFNNLDVERIEDPGDAETEDDYYRHAYFIAVELNDLAARDRGRGFLLLLVALGCFVAAAALLPLHLQGSGVHGRPQETAHATALLLAARPEGMPFPMPLSR